MHTLLQNALVYLTERDDDAGVTGLNDGEAVERNKGNYDDCYDAYDKLFRYSYRIFSHNYSPF